MGSESKIPNEIDSKTTKDCLLKYLNASVNTDISNNDLFSIIEDIYYMEDCLRSGKQIYTREIKLIDHIKYLTIRLNIHASLINKLLLNEEKLYDIITLHTEEMKNKIVKSIIEAT